MSRSTSRHRLSVAALATVVIGMMAPMTAMAGESQSTPTAIPSPGKANAELLNPGCSVPSTRDLRVTKKVYAVGKNRGVGSKVMLSAFEAGWVESHMNNLNCGDRDSVGVFQQRPSQGWCETRAGCLNVKHAANAYFNVAVRNNRSHPGYSAGQLAQSVQRSAYPGRYDAAKRKAQSLLAEAGQGGGVNPYSAKEVCGSGYSVIDSHKLGKAGRAYLLYNSGNKKNCVATLKTTSLKKKTSTSAFLKVKGSKRVTDSGKFQYYAGPVRRAAGGTCVKWGGSAGSQSYTSPFEHCG